MILPNPPVDTITHIKTQNDVIYVASFDKSIKMYKKQLFIGQISHTYPILKMGFLDSKLVFTDIKGNISIDDTLVSTDCGGIQGLVVSNSTIIAAGWNRNLQIIEHGIIQHTINLNYKVFAMDLFKNTLLLGCSNNTYIFMDVRKMDNKIVKSLKSPICSVALRNYAAIGTIEGKIKIDSVNLDLKDNLDSYVFNAHYKLEENKKINYPVNDFIFDKTLISCGSDGKIIEWCIYNKKIIKEIYQSNLSITAIERYENSILAGFSYNFEQGEKECFDPEVRII